MRIAWHACTHPWITPIEATSAPVAAPLQTPLKSWGVSGSSAGGSHLQCARSSDTRWPQKGAPHATALGLYCVVLCCVVLCCVVLCCVVLVLCCVVLCCVVLCCVVLCCVVLCCVVLCCAQQAVRVLGVIPTSRVCDMCVLCDARPASAPRQHPLSQSTRSTAHKAHAPGRKGDAAHSCRRDREGRSASRTAL